MHVDLLEDGGDPKLDKECRYCGCQVVYVLESIKPSVNLGFIGRMEKKMETTLKGLYRGHV